MIHKKILEMVISFFCIFTISSTLAMTHERYFYQKEKKGETNFICLQTADGSQGFINTSILAQATTLYNQRESDFYASGPLLLPLNLTYEDARLLMPFISFAHRVATGIKQETDLCTALNIFPAVKLAQLVKAADAVGSKALLDSVTAVLAEKLQKPQALEMCMKQGSYEIGLEDNLIANTIAQRMFTDSPAHSYWLIKEQVALRGKHQEPPCRYSNEKNVHSWNENQSDLVASSTAPAFCKESLLSERYYGVVSGVSQEKKLTVMDLLHNTKLAAIPWPHQVERLDNFVVSTNKDMCVYSLHEGNGENSSIWMQSLEDGTFIKKFASSSPYLFSLALDSRGKKIATAPVGKTIQLWDLATDSAVALSSHTKYVLNVSFNARGTELLSAGGFDETVRIWDTDTHACIKNFSFNKGPVFQARFINHDNQILTVHSFELCIWDIASGALVQTIRNYPSYSIKLGYRPSDVLINAQTNLLASQHSNNRSSTAHARVHTLFSPATDSYLARSLTIEQAALLLLQYKKKVTNEAIRFPLSSYAGIIRILASYHNPAIPTAFMKTTSWKDWLGLKVAGWLSFFKKLDD